MHSRSIPVSGDSSEWLHRPNCASEQPASLLDSPCSILLAFCHSCSLFKIQIADTIVVISQYCGWVCFLLHFQSYLLCGTCTGRPRCLQTWVSGLNVTWLLLWQLWTNEAQTAPSKRVPFCFLGMSFCPEGLTVASPSLLCLVFKRIPWEWRGQYALPLYCLETTGSGTSSEWGSAAPALSHQIGLPLEVLPGQALPPL